MRISAKADYAVRALLVLARLSGPDAPPVTVDRMAREGDIPPRFLEGILAEVRRAGLVDSKRGSDGGYRIARDPADICVAEIVRVIDGPIIQVAGRDPNDVAYP
ncbi:MAG: Rrf2 family transcriptional regulator, partial [Actinomycetota bacterium]|nr:Rrf2 family transcriptional regulator [Actinomycetota bacterium]